MTHEELLANIKEQEYAYDNLANALLAVVEMHRPALDSEMDEHSDNETLGCAGCGYDFNYGTWETNYPCWTIKAIQEKLS